MSAAALGEQIVIHEDRIDQIIGHYVGDPVRQNAELARLFKAYGLDLGKPLLRKLDVEYLEWRFRQDPNGHILSAKDFDS